MKASSKDFADVLWKNPILRMQMRRRLRAKPVIIWALLTFIPCLFIFLNVYNAASFNTFEMSEAEAKIQALKACFIPTLIVQGIILMFLGTGSVAGGMAEEKESGLLDYQRLTPMTPISKIVGYLFGLPCREYLLFAFTLPFTIISTIWGKLPIGKILLLYAIFFCVVAAYHLTAMVAGMLARKPRRASWFARILVILLYVFLPALSQAGLTVFGHLTIYPTFFGLLASEMEGMADTEFMELWEVVPFYAWKLPPALFSFAILGLLMSVFIFILLRKWQQDTNHSFTKRFALIVFAVVQFLLVGSLLPHLNPEAERINIFLRQMLPFADGLTAAILFIHLLLSLIAILIFLHLTTPYRHTLQKGVRRAGKLSIGKIPFNWDAAPTFVTTLCYLLITGIAYGSLVNYGLKALGENHAPAPVMLLLPFILIGAITFYIQGTRTIWQAPGFFGFLALLWLLPTLTGMTISAFTMSEDALLYLGTTNPIQALFYTLALPFEALSKDTFGNNNEISFSTFTTLSLIFHAMLAALFQFKALNWRRKILNGEPQTSNKHPS